MPNSDIHVEFGLYMKPGIRYELETSQNFQISNSAFNEFDTNLRLHKIFRYRIRYELKSSQNFQISNSVFKAQIQYELKSLCSAHRFWPITKIISNQVDTSKIIQNIIYMRLLTQSNNFKHTFTFIEHHPIR